MEYGTHYRTCHLCEAMCGVAIELKDGRIASIKGDENDPLSRGHICPKAVALQDLHEDPDRLKKPVRKTQSGWQEMEWAEAFDLVAEKLHQTRQDHGRNSIGVYLGSEMCIRDRPGDVRAPGSVSHSRYRSHRSVYLHWRQSHGIQW